MTRLQIIRFIKRRCPKIFPCVKIKFIPDKNIAPFCAQVIKKEPDSFLIELSRKAFLTLSITEAKAIILHELGHIATYNKASNLSEDEYLAHKWAIRIAKKNLLFKIQRELIAVFDSWINYGWNESNGDFRRYILASRIFTIKK